MVVIERDIDKIKLEEIEEVTTNSENGIIYPKFRLRRYKMALIRANTSGGGGGVSSITLFDQFMGGSTGTVTNKTIDTSKAYVIVSYYQSSTLNRTDQAYIVNGELTSVMGTSGDSEMTLSGSTFTYKSKSSLDHNVRMYEIS